jgi:hypothetical protein
MLARVSWAQDRDDLRDELHRRPHRRPRRWPWLAALGVLLVAGLAAYRWLRPPALDAPTDVAPAPAPPVATPPAAPDARRPALAPGPLEAAPPLPPLPPLAESDAAVRDLAAPLGAEPVLPPDNLVPRFVAAADNVANGESPRAHLGFLAPKGRFRVVARDGRLWIDPASYARYDAVADRIAALDAAEVVGLYRRVGPLVAEAHRQLGQPPETFDGTLARAVDELLAVPVVEGDVEVVPKVITYAFADPRLEGMSPAQKHLLRMGPRNVRLVQGQLRAVAGVLGVPARRGLRE